MFQDKKERKKRFSEKFVYVKITWFKIMFKETRNSQVTFEPLMDFKQNHHLSLKYYENSFFNSFLHIS